METQVPSNKICDLHGYSNDLITYQQSKDFPIDGICCTSTLVANRGVVLSFGRLVGHHRVLCIELHESMLLGFQQHDIISPMAWNLRLEYPRTINKFNETIHKKFQT